MVGMLVEYNPENNSTKLKIVDFTGEAEITFFNQNENSVHSSLQDFNFKQFFLKKDANCRFLLSLQCESLKTE